MRHIKASWSMEHSSQVPSVLVMAPHRKAGRLSSLKWLGHCVLGWRRSNDYPPLSTVEGPCSPCAPIVRPPNQWCGVVHLNSTTLFPRALMYKSSLPHGLLAPSNAFFDRNYVNPS